jgi:formylglycine-generating enzyme required for sulfatase activity
MSRMKWVVCVLILGLSGVFTACPVAAAITKPAPNQVFPTGTAAIEFGWDAIPGALSVKLKILFNGTDFDSQGGLTGTSLIMGNTYPPGYYSAIVRGEFAASNGPWCAPVTFLVRRAMTPADNAICNPAPSVFKWTRSAAATRYALKLARYNKATDTYVVLQKVWITQPASGTPKWVPPDNLLTPGKYLWQIIDYSGLTRNYTSWAYFKVTDVPGAGDYLIVDLSGGTAAASYPVTHTNSAPAGGWTDEYKTSRLVMRKIPAWTFTMGSPSNELGRFDDEVQHSVTLTKPFYLGVFEVTQRQWELVMGSKPSHFNNLAYYATRPVERVTYSMIRGSSSGAGWPGSGAVDAASFLGALRAKTGLPTFDLPTEAQWEYACRAGTTTSLNSGKNLTAETNCPHMDEVGRYWHNGGSDNAQTGSTDVATAKVGSYLPNDWGLYDMHGNVWEWCLDWYGDYPGAVSDPAGAPPGASRVLRSGSWNYYGARDCRSANRTKHGPGYKSSSIGFRVARTLP